jgi:hypothetical protein
MGLLWRLDRSRDVPMAALAGYDEGMTVGRQCGKHGRIIGEQKENLGE